MTELSKILPPDLEKWIETRVAEGRYFDAGDYLRDLVRRDQERASLWEEDTARVRQLIEDGEASGLSDEDPFDLIERLIAQRRSD
jgi:antitoxin ParD1/3/4